MKRRKEKESGKKKKERETIKRKERARSQICNSLNIIFINEFIQDVKSALHALLVHVVVGNLNKNFRLSCTQFDYISEQAYFKVSQPQDGNKRVHTNFKVFTVIRIKYKRKHLLTNATTT